MENGLLTLLSLALGLGLLHALDADHILAVSGLISAHPGRAAGRRFCLRWAAGHGLALLLIGAAVLWLGMVLPAAFNTYAEGLVGLALLVIAAGVWRDLWRRDIHLHFHAHEGVAPHAHWHRHGGANRTQHRHAHGAVLVGVLHGAAGSAPLLALLPLARLASPWLGFIYLLVFAAGVACAMLLFGGLLGAALEKLARGRARSLHRARAGLAVGALGWGLVFLYGVTGR